MQEAWQRFVPVMWLMALLVGANLGAAIYVLVTEHESLWVDVAIVSFDTAVILLFVLREWGPVMQALQVRVVSQRQWLLAGFTFLLVAGFAEIYFVLVEPIFGMAAMLDSFREQEWPKLAAVGLICVWPAIFEELAFRGFLQSRLIPLLGQRDALLVQAALFSFLHMSPAVFISHFVIGLGFGIIRMRTGSLIPSMLAHGSWNGYVLLQEGLLDPW